MAIRGLDHINIATANLDATRDFFVEVLGFEEGWRPAVISRGAWLYMDGRALVHLVERPDAPRPSKGSALDHFAFSIDDYDGAVRRLEAHGIDYEAFALPDGGIRQLVLTDLNGVTIELNCRSA